MSGFAFGRVIINKGARQFYLIQSSLQIQCLLLIGERTAVKAVEDALQYIKMYVTGVSANTAEPKYLKNVEEQVIRLQSKVWSNL